MPVSPEYIIKPEQENRGQFVYSCATCNDILAVRKKLETPDHIADPLSGTCPSCGAKLENSIDCKQGRAPEGWHNPILSVDRTKVRRRAPLLQRASSYNRFSLDFSPCDKLLQPLAPDNLVMLQGHSASAIAELAAFRAQLPPERGGLDSTTTFVDGGNCSDPYLFASLAKRYSFDSKRALRRVTNCRVFTMYQLANLLSNDIMKMTETYGSKLLVISNLLGTFNEPETSAREVDRLLDAIHAGILEVKKKLVVIATLESPNKYDAVVTSWSDTLVRLSPLRRGSIQADLLRHPTKKSVAVEFDMNRLLFHPDSPLEVVR
jgi:hypothetical protein